MKYEWIFAFVCLFSHSFSVLITILPDYSFCQFSVLKNVSDNTDV